jgi:MFS family permease
MTENLNMKQIRNDLYRSYTEDGLVDLAIGLVIFGFGALLLVDIPWLIAVLGLIPLSVWYLGKRYLTSPRVGTFEPSASMDKKFKGFFISLLTIGLGVLVFFVLGNRSAAHPLALFGLILALGISVLGLLMKTNRLYYYAFLVFTAMALGEALNPSIKDIDIYLLAVIIAGGVILITGSMVLWRFVRKYPVVSMEE